MFCYCAMGILNQRQVQGNKKVNFLFAIGMLIVYLLKTSRNLHSWKHIFQCISTILYDHQKRDWILQHLMICSIYLHLISDGYNLVLTDYPNNIKRGGVCIYYKESLPVWVTSLPYLKEAWLLEITYSNKKVIMSVIYRSPSQNNNEFDLFLYNFEKPLSNISKR